jgi:hypothetical protein
MHDERHMHVGGLLMYCLRVMPQSLSCRLCFLTAHSLAWCGWLAFAILEAPVELAISVHLDWSFYKTDHRDTPASVPHLAKCDVNPVFLRHYAPVAECSLQNFDPFEPFRRTVSWTDKLIRHYH